MVFERNQIFYGFYETLFSQAEINRLTNFLECPAMSPNFGKVIHSSPKSDVEIEGLNELHQEIREFYTPTYTWVQKRFGDAVPKAWRV